MSTLPAERWPSPPPLPDNPTKYRESMLGERERITRYQTEITAKSIEYYPELQAAVLKLLHKHPSPHLVQHMAEALLKELHPPGGSPTDVDRLNAINLVRTALQAAADFTSEEKEEAPF